MLKVHGGFRTGDTVEVRESGRWLPNTHIISDFDFLRVEVYPASFETVKHYPNMKFWKSINDVRHPRFVKEKV